MLKRTRARMLAAGLGLFVVGGSIGCWNTPQRPNNSNVNTNIPKTNVNSGLGSNTSGTSNSRVSGAPSGESTTKLGSLTGSGNTPPGSGGSPSHFDQNPGSGGQPIAKSTPGTKTTIQPVAHFGVASGANGAPLPPPDATPSTMKREIPGIEPVVDQDLGKRARFERRAPVMDDSLTPLPQRPSNPSRELPPLGPPPPMQ